MSEGTVVTQGDRGDRLHARVEEAQRLRGAWGTVTQHAIALASHLLSASLSIHSVSFFLDGILRVDKLSTLATTEQA